MLKVFEGQGKDEKVLCHEKEHIGSIIVGNVGNIFTVLAGVFIFSYIAFSFSIGVGYILVFDLIVLVLFIVYVYLFWDGTYLIVTNKRILKFVKDGIFSSHYKEMKLLNLQEKVGKVGGFIGKIFHYGDVSFKGKDEANVIWFRGVRAPKEITMYVSRLKEYIIENPDYEISHLNEFKLRKERYKDSGEQPVSIDDAGM